MKSMKNYFFNLATVIYTVAILPGIALANGPHYVPLTKGLENKVVLGGGVVDFINYLLLISVGVASILAVIMITIGGFSYMTSESVFRLGESKEKIVDAIIGLLIVLLAVLLLYTINEDIVSLRIFKI